MRYNPSVKSLRKSHHIRTSVRPILIRPRDRDIHITCFFLASASHLKGGHGRSGRGRERESKRENTIQLGDPSPSASSSHLLNVGPHVVANRRCLQWSFRFSTLLQKLGYTLVVAVKRAGRKKGPLEFHRTHTHNHDALFIFK